jgi:hypothetical protein
VCNRGLSDAQALEAKGRVRSDRHGLYEIIEQPSNPPPA